MRKRGSTSLVCSIGSSDPTSGAGLFLDAAVYARLGRIRSVYVVAGVTAQNSRRVSRVVPVKADAIRAQLDAILEQVTPDAFRIGLIPGKSACLAVGDRLRKMAKRPPVVVDPVIAASSGARLQPSGGIEGLRRLLRVADVVTPNAAEAATLAAMRVVDVPGAERAAATIAKRYGCAVLVTGGHLNGDGSVVDVLATPTGDVRRFSSTRLRVDARGTGCILAAALTAALARGLDLVAAVRSARRFVRAALVGSRPLGRGGRQFDAAGVPGAAV